MSISRTSSAAVKPSPPLQRKLLVYICFKPVFIIFVVYSTDDDAGFIRNMGLLLRCCEMTIQAIVDPKLSKISVANKVQQPAAAVHINACRDVFSI